MTTKNFVTKRLRRWKVIKENFAPTSADDLNEQGRKSDVLVSALEKCEKLEKQLKIAKKGLTEIKIYGDAKYDCDIAKRYLKQIGEIK